MRQLLKSLMVSTLICHVTSSAVAQENTTSITANADLLFNNICHKTQPCKHLTKQKINHYLSEANKNDKIIDLMNRKFEAKPWYQYQVLSTDAHRIQLGKNFYKNYQSAFDKLETQDVEKEIILGILGVETNYGNNTGSFKVLDALYTLAFSYPGDDSSSEYVKKRKQYFQGELATFLDLVEQKKLPVELKGSYAGAFGMTQFMPSSYRDYAVAAPGKKTPADLYDPDDAIASINHYLIKKGHYTTTKPVMTPISKLDDLFGKSNKSTSPIARYETNVLETREQNSVDQPEKTYEYFIIGQNGKAILTYNNSVNYMRAVYELGQTIVSQKHA